MRIYGLFRAFSEAQRRRADYHSKQAALEGGGGGPRLEDLSLLFQFFYLILRLPPWRFPGADTHDELPAGLLPRHAPPPSHPILLPRWRRSFRPRVGFTATILGLLALDPPSSVPFGPSFLESCGWKWGR